MESSPGPARRTRTPTTPTCTVPGLLVGLTKLFNLTKVCTAPPPAADNDAGNGGEAASTTKPDPDPGPEPKLVLVRLFDAVSALKSSYVKLQRAHFPYDPDEVAVADEAVASELDSLAALHCLCVSRRGIGPLVDDRWERVQQLEAEARRRDADIAALARELRRMQRENARLNRQVVVGRRNDERRRPAGVISVPKELATPAALVSQFMAASRSVGDFADLLLRGGACSLTAAKPEPCVVSGDADAEQACSWRRYSLEAHLWRGMLLVAGGAGEEECWSGGGGGGDAGCSSFRRIMKPVDALDALMQFPRSGLSSFCRAAYLAAVPAEAEAAACGNHDHRSFVSHGGHPRTRYYRAFAAAARSVWALRVLMTAVARRSSESKQGAGGGGGVSVRMFYAGRGSVYASEFMESVPALSAEEARCVEVEEEEEKLTIEFTVTPGVKVGDTVVPCRVLLCRRREREGRVAPCRSDDGSRRSEGR